MNIYYEAAIWIGMALLAALVSIRIALPVATVTVTTPPVWDLLLRLRAAA